MTFKQFFVGAAGLALVVAPTSAIANPASSLSVASSTRASAPSGESELSAPGSFIGLALAAVIIAAGIYIAVDDDDGPDSP